MAFQKVEYFIHQSLQLLQVHSLLCLRDLLAFRTVPDIARLPNCLLYELESLHSCECFGSHHSCVLSALSEPISEITQHDCSELVSTRASISNTVLCALQLLFCRPLGFESLHVDTVYGGKDFVLQVKLEAHLRNHVERKDRLSLFLSVRDDLIELKEGFAVNYECLVVALRLFHGPASLDERPQVGDLRCNTLQKTD